MKSFTHRRCDPEILVNCLIRASWHPLPSMRPSATLAPQPPAPASLCIRDSQESPGPSPLRCPESHGRLPPPPAPTNRSPVAPALRRVLLEAPCAPFLPPGVCEGTSPALWRISEALPAPVRALPCCGSRNTPRLCHASQPASVAGHRSPTHVSSAEESAAAQYAMPRPPWILRNEGGGRSSETARPKAPSPLPRAAAIPSEGGRHP
mmetsp:Transcript_12642/g.23810  ORF Transcript_12642/g.23810 Transcript_12642/m.23810 type:complete len:207 (+) Transcript_12642:114-734(+)